MKLSAWAKKQGISYTNGSATGGYQCAPSRWRQEPSSSTTKRRRPPLLLLSTARVFSHEQKAQLTAELGRLSEYASREKLIVSHSVAEIGSGVNGHRPKPKTHEVAEKQGRPGSRRRASGPSLSVSALKMLNARRQSRPCETSSDLIRQNPLTRNKTRI